MAKHRGNTIFTGSFTQPVVSTKFSTSMTMVVPEPSEIIDESDIIEPSDVISVSISIQSGRNQYRQTLKLTKIDTLAGMLTGPQAKEVVIFGENNFTFQLALATLRNNSWDGIHHGVRKYDDEKLKSIDFSNKNGRKLGLSETDILANIKILLDTPLPPSSQINEGKVVWYQYPWEERSATVKDALDEMKDAQKPKDYLLFGIITGIGENSEPRDYKLKEVLGDELQNTEYNGYTFLGGDKGLIKKMLSFGYRDISDYNNSHAITLTEHVTLVFQRNE